MDSYKDFHRLSSITLKNSDQFSKVASWVSSLHDFSKKMSFKKPLKWERYYSLKMYDKRTSFPIELLLSTRRSQRFFTSKKISIVDFSFILNHSLGVNNIKESNIYFSYPSSGGIHSIVPIIVINNVEGIENGIYYYEAIDYELYKISDFQTNDYEKITSSTDIAKNSAFSIHLFVDSTQKCYKYQDRGYRFLLLECGHVMQNIHLCSTSLGIGCVMSGGSLDEPTILELRSLIEENGLMVLYECFLGSI